MDKIKALQSLLNGTASEEEIQLLKQGIVSGEISIGMKIGVSSLAFSPDGKYVVSRSHDNTARVWIYLIEDLIEEACLRVTRNLTQAEWNQYIGDALPHQAVCPKLAVEP